MPTAKERNRIKCAYCAWTTQRFRGKRIIGERELRFHCLTEHEAQYMARIGFVKVDDDTLWCLDEDERGEQAL